jgi:hypothetical protein
MSEQNILNPTVGSDFNPDYSYTEGLPQMMSQFQAKSGKAIARQLLARGRVYDLQWQSRPKSTADVLRQWEAQYRNDFFSYQDIERGRYFSGRFVAPPQISPAGFNKWNIQAQFVEIPGLPMFAFPGGTLWGQDSIAIYVRDGFGSNLVKLTGAGWSGFRTDLAAQISPGAPGTFTSNNNGEYAEYVYYGYGFRVWGPKSSDRCKADVYLDGVFAATIDYYSASLVTSSVLLTVLTTVGLHRVKLIINGKNVSSSAQNLVLDQIEAMQ